MEQEKLESYMLEQAKIEIEHTRSWPTKILAFYVTINFGIVGAHLALTGRTPPINAPLCAKLFITLFVIGLFMWAALVLGKNHLSYLRHRNIQIHFQIENLKKYKDTLPKDWFILNEIRWFVRKGWWFYLYLMFLITALTMGGVWLIG